jgi:sec-independent protein translocase protein TatC
MKNRKNMTILSHLAEIKSRLLRSFIAVVIASAVCFIFADRIFQLLIWPVKGTQFIFVDMTEMVGVYMKVCITAGIMLAMPYLLYHILSFITPALNSKEKRTIFMVLPMIVLMFLAGIAFSYFVMLPPALNFLTTFGSNIATPQIRITSYVAVSTRLMLASGIVFELPVISTFLARIGVITGEWLASKRKFAFIMAFVLGAIITPTFDPINQTLIALPLIVLYELSIWLAKMVRKKSVDPELALPEPIN